MAGNFARVVVVSALAITPIALVANERGGLAAATDRVQTVWDGFVADARQHVDELQGHSGANANPGAETQPRGSGTGGTSDRGVSPWGPQSGTSGESGVPEVSGVAVRSQPGAVMIRTVLPGGEGAGSGIVWKSDGTIITNYHVVKDSTQIQVTTADGSRHTADMVGFSRSNDIAVLKLRDAVKLVPARFDSTPEVGERVNAVGQGGGRNVLYRASGKVVGLVQSITASSEAGGALDSSDAERLRNLIATNAPIVAGYSGGPLFDLEGDVIGINTAASSTTPIEGFAVPTSTMLQVAQGIDSGKRSGDIQIGRRGSLGVYVDAHSARNSDGASVGAPVVKVLEGSAAARAGIEPGSLITGVDGVSISSSSQLTSALRGKSPGDKATLTWVDPQGEELTATVSLTTSVTN